MDCCNTKTEKECCKDLQKLNKMKGGNMKVNKKTLLWIAIAVLLVATIYLTFKTGSTSSVSAVQSTATAARTAASSGMVGGC